MSEDVFENSSSALSAVVADVLDDETIAQPATLADVRRAILSGVDTPTVPLNRFSNGELQHLRSEIDSLIATYGADALAVGFFRPWAGPALRCLIDAARDEYGDITLGRVFQAA
jgi:hypothetical protein